MRLRRALILLVLSATALPAASYAAGRGVSSIGGRGAPGRTPTRTSPVSRGVDLARTACPAGSRPVPTDSVTIPYICAPGDGGADPDACRRFNTRVTSFYRSGLRSFDELKESHHSMEGDIRSRILELKEISLHLKRKSFRARHPNIRKLLKRQAREVDGDIRGRQRELRELRREHEERREVWKKRYGSRARDLLLGRPPGCSVNAVR